MTLALAVILVVAIVKRRLKRVAVCFIPMSPWCLVIAKPVCSIAYTANNGAKIQGGPAMQFVDGARDNKQQQHLHIFFHDDFHTCTAA